MRYLLAACGLSALLLCSCDFTLNAPGQMNEIIEKEPDREYVLPSQSQFEETITETKVSTVVSVAKATESVSDTSYSQTTQLTTVELTTDLSKPKTTHYKTESTKKATSTSDSITKETTSTTETVALPTFNLQDVPPYSDTPFVSINNNCPFFQLTDYPSDSFDYYSPLDDLGRCGECMACIGLDLMPTGARESIGMIKPSGWQLVRYDGIVDGNYLFNRCHLIGYQLTGENANLSNLITGTRYLNVVSMLHFENLTAEYIRATGNHVLYRVTPCFEGDNLLATGVLMEAESVEDNGTGLMFNVFCYNIQPQIFINYSTGETHLIEENSEQNANDRLSPYLSEHDQTEDDDIPVQDGSEGKEYILNINTKKFHYPNCSSVTDMKEKNKQEYTGYRDELIEKGYAPCGQCKP